MSVRDPARDAWEPALLRGTDGSTLGAWVRQPNALAGLRALTAALEGGR